MSGRGWARETRPKSSLFEGVSSPPRCPRSRSNYRFERENPPAGAVFVVVVVVVVVTTAMFRRSLVSAYDRACPTGINRASWCRTHVFTPRDCYSAVPLTVAVAA